MHIYSANKIYAKSLLKEAMSAVSLNKEDGRYRHAKKNWPCCKKNQEQTIAKHRKRVERTTGRG